MMWVVKGFCNGLWVMYFFFGLIYDNKVIIFFVLLFVIFIMIEVGSLI